MDVSNLIIPSSNCNPKSVRVFFLNDFDPRDPELPGGAFPSRLWKHHLAIRYLVGRIGDFVEGVLDELQRANEFRVIAAQELHFHAHRP